MPDRPVTEGTSIGVGEDGWPVEISLCYLTDLHRLLPDEQGEDRIQQSRTYVLKSATPSGTRIEEGHRVEISFEDGTYAKLIHPKSGCKAPLVCGQCAADLTDPEAKRCYDCEGMEAEGCWLEGWFDNLDASELLRGKVTLPIDAEWDFDHPIVTVLAATPSNPTGLEDWLGSEEALGVVLKAMADAPRDEDVPLMTDMAEFILKALAQAVPGGDDQASKGGDGS